MCLLCPLRKAEGGTLTILHQSWQEALTQAKYTGEQQDSNGGNKTADGPISNGVYFLEMKEPGYRPEIKIIRQG